MSLIFKELKLRNFLSFGNVEEVLELNSTPYQIVVGQNSDKSESLLDRNGSGKSSMLEALHYAIYGKSIGNRITLGNLINNVNKKNMLVTLFFEKDNVLYTIERGRSPNVLKFYKNNEEEVVDESQGDSRETQEEIEKVIGMDSDVFCQIVCLSCKVPVFTEQTTANQKSIIEHILGINIISEKIDSLKALIKETKNEYNNELFKYNTIKQQNDNLSASIEKQINDMNVAKANYYHEINQKIANTQNEINNLEKIDIDLEMKNFKIIEENNKKIQEINEIAVARNDCIKALNDVTMDIANHEKIIEELGKIDFETERNNIAYNNSLQQQQLEYLKQEHEWKEKQATKQLLDNKFIELSKLIETKQQEVDNLKDNICPTCGQPTNSNVIEQLKNQKLEEIKQLSEQRHQMDLDILEYNHLVGSFEKKTFELKPCKFKVLQEVDYAENQLKQALTELENNKQAKENLEKTLETIVIPEIPERPATFYKTIEDAYKHQALLQSLKTTKESLEKSLLVNPFEQQEKSIEELKKNIQPLDDTVLNEISDTLTHQEFLLKLLNSPSSFVRTTILDKSLEFLNAKILQYLSEVGSMHVVSFNNDMSLTIQQMGVEYGYISTGEMGRVSIALNLAFRDAWETLNNCKINLLAIDEVIDRIGLDTSGVNMAVDILKNKEDKNIMLVTHNDTLINQAPCLLTVVKENGFSEIVKG